LSQLQFLFTNELSASGIVVLCSDQKFKNVSHEKIDIKIEIAIFDKLYSPEMVVTTKYTVKDLRKEKNKKKQNKWHLLV